MAIPQRSEVWLVDLGMVAKIRPGLVMSVQPGDQDRQLATPVPHTTSVPGTRFEIVIPKTFLRSGAFDARGLATVGPTRFIRKRGALQPRESALAEEALWIGWADELPNFWRKVCRKDKTRRLMGRCVWGLDFLAALIPLCVEMSARLK